MGVVLVASVLPQFADFDGIDRLVVVERPGIEFRNAEREGAGDGQQHRQCAPAIHPEEREETTNGHE